MDRQQCILSLFILLGSLICLSQSKYCTQYYKESVKCTKQHKTSTGCGPFWAFRCTKYRQVSTTCTVTKSRQGCCTGYTGSGCSSALCFGSTSCPNGGTCYEPDKCRCQSGFSGSICDDTNECSLGTAGCEQDCINTHGSFQCSCRDGYLLNSDAKTCLDLNECYTDNGGCEQICTNTHGSFQCECTDGYALNGDGKTCTDINECSAAATGCEQLCYNQDGTYLCSCGPGYTLAEDGIACDDVDECTDGTDSCDQQCHNTVGSFTCACNPGYIFQEDGQICHDINECLDNNGGCGHTCRNEIGGYTCDCFDGFRLEADKHSCADIDECEEGLSGCQQVCANNVGSYECDCSNGYELGDDMRTCHDIDDCVRRECHNGGTCVDGLSSYSCACAPGFTDTQCETDINECDLLNGGCQEICSNSHGSFACSCSGNKTLGSDSVTCKGDIDDDTVFHRHSIHRRLLPRGCSILELASCKTASDLSIVLSSTSDWYQMKTQQTVYYTFGIVFVESDPLSVPISLQGVKVTKVAWTFSIDIRVTDLESSDGFLLDNTVQPAKNCLSFDMTANDLFDFINAGSFLRSVFDSIIPALPNWASIVRTSISVLDESDMHTSLVYGDAVNEIRWCNGAPVQYDHFYSVFLFNTNFAIRIYGKEIKLPKSLHGEKFCIIVDICQTFGGTFFIMLPVESRDFLKEVEIFKSLYTNHGLTISPSGIGLSFTRDVSVASDKTALTLWNGVHTFQHPSMSYANLWIGGEFTKTSKLLTASGKLNLYLSVPSIDKILTTAFVDEWNMLLDAELATELKIPLTVSHQTHELVVPARGWVEGYSSIGNYENREMCGENSNPQGLFTSMKVDLSGTVGIFKSIPILEDWKLDASVSFYSFVTSTLASDSAPNIKDMINDIASIEETLNSFMELLQGITGHLVEHVSEHAHAILSGLVDASEQLKVSLLDIIHSIEQGISFSVSEIFYDIWAQFLNIQSAVQEFTDDTEFNAVVVSHNTTTVFLQNMQRITDNIEKTISRIIDTTISNLQNYTSFGFKCKASISILSFDIGTADVEFVSASENLALCSRYSKVYELLKDEKAVRFIGRLSDSIVLGLFLYADVEEAGIGGALSESSSKFVVQLSVTVNIFGRKTKTDVFINNNGLHIFFEARVWYTFLAQLEISATAGRKWHELTYKVHGKFVTESKNKSPSSSFKASYLDGLRNVIKQVSAEAERRISGVQDAVSNAQEGMEKAKQWLDEKQKDVRKANDAFDDAVQSLENTNQTLDDTREEFRKGEEKLAEAQKDINKLCKIKTCNPVCIPGLKCKMCKKGWIRYPCCRWTSCMIKVPNLLCEAANLACRILRAVAFGILEIAKLVVKAVMVAFDVAKSAVSVAQVVVDKSRVVFTLAEGVLELAKIGLDGVNGVLEAAKEALEVVKVVIKGSLMVLDYVISIGLQSIIDVRNCYFNVEMSTSDLAVFDVGCEVNAFNAGWKTVRFRINFKNVFQTIWQAAKATINAIVKGFAVIGRKRRSTVFDSNSKIHTLLRSVRETHVSGENFTMGSVIDITSNNEEQAATTDGDYENRVHLFGIKCENITNVLLFLTESFDVLYDIANETKFYIDEAEVLKADLKHIDLQSISENMTLENSEIGVDAATSEFNMTQSDLDTVMEYAKGNISSDPMMVESAQAVSLSSDAIDQEMRAAESVQIMNQWIQVMENSTNEYFNESECYRFRDCVYHAISLLYDLYSYEEIPNLPLIQQTIMELEDTILEIFQNTSETIQTTYDASSSVMANIEVLTDTNLFCSTPPTFTTEPSNTTVTIGDTLNLVCGASADPEPAYWWFRNNELLLSDTHAMLEIVNASVEDGGMYHCMAGNVVANISSNPVFVTAVVRSATASTETPEVVADPEEDTSKSYTIILATTLAGGFVAILAVVGLVMWRCHMRSRKIKDLFQTRSATSMQMIHPGKGRQVMYIHVCPLANRQTNNTP